MTLVRFRVTGMDCARDAVDIERAVAAVSGVESVKVSVASQLMSVRVSKSDVLAGIEQATASIGYPVEPIHPVGDQVQALPVRAGYRRALWIVVALNVGYGIFEVAGGFFAASQAVKADALDFLGDGLISFLALLAIGWRFAWRARVALLQGMFLGVLGLGVLASTMYRVLVLNRPDAELMGAFGVVALLVNVAAAAVLIPHRTGDANARAVWLFSRNDALGNLAVIVAAGLVSWTGRAWPDLVVAAVIASLFLHSAWAIVRDARGDLRAAA